MPGINEEATKSGEFMVTHAACGRRLKWKRKSLDKTKIL